jgi:hypothetical protein
MLRCLWEERAFPAMHNLVRRSLLFSVGIACSCSAACVIHNTQASGAAKHHQDMHQQLPYCCSQWSNLHPTYLGLCCAQAGTNMAVDCAGA